MRLVEAPAGVQSELRGLYFIIIIYEIRFHSYHLGGDPSRCCVQGAGRNLAPRSDSLMTAAVMQDEHFAQ